MDDYEAFLAAKALTAPAAGIDPPERLHPSLYPFQHALTRWALRRGRAAIFADCGLGKTRMQLEWAEHAGDRTLIVAPLCVAEQTIAEAGELDMEVRFCARPTDEPGVWITNYEKLQHFVGAPYDAIVLDESSVLKSIDGTTRRMLIQEFTDIPMRLCCTATPAPNDMVEMGNHAEFLGIMSRTEMLASFFVHDSSSGGSAGWRLKGHGEEAFWRWLASWSMWLRRPSDIGFDDAGFDLPELREHVHACATEWKQEGMLFAAPLSGISERAKVRVETVEDRLRMALDLIDSSDGEPWLVWVDRNVEGDAVKKAFGDRATQISGTDDEELRAAKHSAWRAGKVSLLVTKPSIFGWGMNWQHCARVMFFGLSDSYESYYQAVRRCWRFGQRRPVDVHIVVSEPERVVVQNVQRKASDCDRIVAGILGHVAPIEQETIVGTEKETDTYAEDIATGDGWTLRLGDSVERMREIADDSVALSVFSPPFASLYTYSNSARDLGNSRTYEEFFEHFGYISTELARATMPGRRAAVHVQQVTLTKVSHGVIGWRDFRADTVAMMQRYGWVYDGEIVIDKDPQAQAIRTKSKSLMFVQKERDSSWLRPAMADYILLFRAPGENAVPVHSDATNEEWILWARPIWYGIRESDTLQFRTAREDKDEKHICPLQLETIERCVRLWTNPGELVCSPFAGIGSEGYVALRHGRTFTGIELKRIYWQTAARNLEDAAKQQAPLFAEGE